MVEAPRPHRPFTLQLLSFAHRVAHRLSGGRVGTLDPARQAPRGRALRVITRVHRTLYRCTGGIVGGNAGGLATLLLTTTGRKTGIARTVPLPYFPAPEAYGDAVLVVASNAGDALDPAWYLNLASQPEVIVQVGFRKGPRTAEVPAGQEREALWRHVTSLAAMYADYQRGTDRTIPVVVLRKRG